MESVTTGHYAIDHDDMGVNYWRVSQLQRLGIPSPTSRVYARRVDWRDVAWLVQRGCPPVLALRIVS
ncbi:MAG: hypothetical protein JWN95_143 [Frankiales bacterium]|nr:hypothetical protein [Frankiales bacterium]